jgi:hypothetical protein
MTFAELSWHLFYEVYVHPYNPPGMKLVYSYPKENARPAGFA